MSSLNISDYIREKFDNVPGKRAAALADEILKKTGHIPVVTTIARGTGFCTYHARLTEAIGAQPLEGHTIDRACGKGDDIHKILGLSSLRIFSNNWREANVGEVIEEAADELRRHSIIQYEANLEESKREAEKLMLNLLGKIGQFEEITGMKVADAVPIVEQQLIDYELRIRGIPDLILESKKEQKAIVVDWKTSRETPSKYEAVQVICYALLESRRLSCTKEEAIDKITGKPEGNKLTSVDILPVIIRDDPWLSLKPHPVFSKPEKLRDDYEEFRKLVRNAIIMAQHLTLLICNQKAITNISPDETSGPVPWGSGKVNYLRLTPFDIGLYHGDPSKQTGYPCKVCYLKDPCRFYFGRPYGKKDEYDTTMWKLRFNVLDKKEKQLMAYLALYHIFESYTYNEVVDRIKRGYGFECLVGDTPWPDRKACGRIIIRSTKGEEQSYRIDLLDKITKSSAFSLEAERDIREYEQQGLLRVINEGKPVFIAMPYQDINPLLSVNAFGRVDSVDNEDGKVKYVIGLPSKVLRYQMLLFSHYLKNNTFGNEGLIMVETDVDLTRMELNAIDYLHRILKEEENKPGTEDYKREIEREVKILENSRQSGVDSDESTDLEQYLKKIIEAGAKKRDLQDQ